MNGGGWSVETWDQSRGQTGDLERGTAHTQRPETSDASDTAATSLPASVVPCLACKPGRARPTLALRASQKLGQFSQSNVMGGPPFPSLGWPLALRKRGKDAFRGHRSSTRQAQVSDISRFASLHPFNLNQRFFSLNTPRTLALSRRIVCRESQYRPTTSNGAALSTCLTRPNVAMTCSTCSTYLCS
jgi:hypothetical protein